jgi:drug/metabolite transporter (DMT)-like permease
MLLGLGMIWGSSFPLLKVALESLTPVSAAAFRLTLAAIAMTAVIYALGLRLTPKWQTWKHYGVVAFIGNVLPFLLICWAEQFINAALASVLMGLVPLATMVAAHFFTSDEKITANKLVGVILGGCGVVVLIGIDVLGEIGSYALAQLAIVGAACCYGVSTVYVRRSKITDNNPLSNAAGILICSSLLSLPLAFIFESPTTLHITDRSLIATTVLALVCTCAAYFLLYSLLAQVGATFTSYNNYLVPVFGMLVSVVLLDEPIQNSTYIALVLIFSGLLISQRKSRNAHPPHPINS